MKDFAFSKKKMYEAMIQKDPEFEGQFIVAVKTTGIFCRPTCRARKPKLENVEFFHTPKEALENGYRACKVCHPMDSVKPVPQNITDLLRELQEKPMNKITDTDLLSRGMQPATIKRWFMKEYNMTFHAYQRYSRINNAFVKIQEGQNVTESALDAGYESLSGFSNAYKKIIKTNPSGSADKEVVYYILFETVLGQMIAAASNEALYLLEFMDRKTLEMELGFIQKNSLTEIIPGTNEILEKTQKEIREYFEGKRMHFDIPLQILGTNFQKKAWESLQRIPYGTAVSYKYEAQDIGDVKAVRAVAHANGQNHISIIIPCHRVIGNNGTLTGYGGGVWRKKWMLDMERENKKG